MKKSVFVFSLFLALIVISCGQKEKINQAEPYFVPVEETLLQDVTMTASDAEPGVANQWLAFRKDFDLEEVPSVAEARIAVDSKYWLWINGIMKKPMAPRIMLTI